MNIMQFIFSHKWMMYQPALHSLIEIVSRVSDDPAAIAKAFHGTNFEQYLTEEGQPAKHALLNSMDYPTVDNTYKAQRVGDVAILPVIGGIFPRGASVPMSYGSNVQLDKFNHDFNVLMADSTIKTIINVFDTPGGEVTGVSETAQMIAEGRKTKEVISYGYGMVASAGMWLYSAGGRYAGSNTSEFGSIGVVASYTDTSDYDAKKGIKRHEIVSNLSPNKRPDLSSDAGRAGMQKVVDDLAFIFVDTVASNMGVDFKTVIEKFGQGSMFVASEAQERGMIQDITTLDALINSVKSNNNSNFTGGTFMTLEEMKAKDPEGYKAIMAEASKQATDATADATAKAVTEATEAGKAQGIQISEEAQALQVKKDKEAKDKENSDALSQDQASLSEALDHVGAKGTLYGAGADTDERKSFVATAVKSMNTSRKM